MEQRPVIERRSASFNPEAATFSPTKGNAVPWLSAGKHVSTPPQSPQKTASVPGSAMNESPFRPAPELRPIYEAWDESHASQLSDAQSYPGYMPLDLHDLIQVLEQARQEAQNNTLSLQSIDTPLPYPLPGFVFPQRHEPDFSAPEVDELSKTLGLPGIVSKEKSGEEGEVCFYNASNYDDRADRNFRQKLMEQALGKPLTATTLAHYMNCPSVSKAQAASYSSRPGREYGVVPEQTNGQDASTKMIQPPPGFFGENPRIINAEDSNATVIPDSKPIPTGLSAFTKTRRFSELQSPILPQHQPPQYRGSSNRRNTRPRAPTRTKRSDQGPEPSPADIYPEDAIYIPSNSSISSRRPSFAVPDPHITTLPEYTFVSPRGLPTHQHSNIQDPTSWPTPAEVYAGKPALTTTAPAAAVQQPTPPPAPTTTTATATEPAIFDVFADHVPPSESDIQDANSHVDALLDLAPYLFALELPDPATQNERPMMPGQIDGSRYGLVFHGIGMGDAWKGAPLPPLDVHGVRL